MSAFVTDWPSKTHRPRGRFRIHDGALGTVLDELTRRGRNQLWLGAEMGVDVGYLSRVNHRKQRLTRRIVEDCARILEMPAGELFSPDDLARMETDGVMREESNIRRARQFFQESYGVLSDEQWAEVVAFAAGLRKGGRVWRTR